jgi:hypothetical protein
MRYGTVYLDVEADEARRRIADRCPGVRARTLGDRTEYRTNAGYLLATLSEGVSPEGTEGSKLRYRTATISGHHAHARRAARRIREAVSEFEVD